MTKSLIIEFDPQHEGLLLALFKKLQVKTIDVKAFSLKKGDILPDTNDEDIEEHIYVQKALKQKFVETGQWENMSDDEQQDAALAEMMIYEQERPDYKVMTAEESETFYATLKKQLYANPTD
ncbi:MAG: hypothetical protein JNL70_18035 [Saprospiraceae bacterium]|nr:hypothetical protein [Saprospiraceae bacterium]